MEGSEPGSDGSPATPEAVAQHRTEQGVKPPEQSAEQEIQALLGELDHQNDDQLGGRLLAKLPISAQDTREASFFTQGDLVQTGPSDARRVEDRLYGVHPDWGPIYLAGPLAKSLNGEIAQTLKSDSDEVAIRPEGNLEGLLAQANANGEANSIAPVRDESHLAEWAGIYQASKDKAGEMKARLETEKKVMFTQQALDVVTGKRVVRDVGLTSKTAPVQP